MDTIKKYWKEITMFLLSLFFIANCTSKGNFQRKCARLEIEHKAEIDSINDVFANSVKTIDSLKNAIKMRDAKIESLENEIRIYQDQNDKLANKPVVVKVSKK
jgi:septal ring factor EnvC (AmiA/AmiB activator)